MAGDKPKSAKASLWVRAAHVFGGLVLIALAFGWWWGIQMAQADSAGLPFWTKTPCRVVQSSGRAVPKGYKFLVQYEYEVNGEAFTSKRHRLNPIVFYSAQEAMELAREFSAGADSFCYVDPSNPTKAVLETDKYSFWFLYPICLAFLFAAASGFRKAWLGLPLEYRIGDYALLERLAIACLMAALLSGGLAYGRIPALWSAYANAPSEGWEKTECTVALSRVLTKHSGRRDLYKADVLYSYFYNGKQYWSNAYKYDQKPSIESGSQEAIIAKYPRGARTVCFVNPRKPGLAVLKTGYSPDMSRALSSLLIIIPGLCGILLAFWPGIGISDWIVNYPDSKRKKTHRPKSKTMLIKPVIPRTRESSLQNRRKNRNERRPNRRAAGFDGNRIQPGVDCLVLRTRTSGVGQSLGALLLNLAMTAAAFFIITDSPGAEAVLLFLIYAPVGLTVLFKSRPFFLAAFNPRVTATIHASSLHLGDNVKLTWEAKGNLGKAQGLAFILAGEEKVIYKLGKRNLSGRHVFYTEEQFQTSAPSLMRKGEIKLHIPLETMHSLETSISSPGEKKKYFVNWKLRVHLAMEGRNNTRNEYPLDIQPLQS
ncbi:hypothetical protein Dalk_3091 [Desulfatibacillum aliphaticivorans]|uniref:DUF3592 domain-containing protein n=1 Tax=Desulfatibacillum aliphaticivorans TaxID=218208 RepID=B8FBM8_DESAL|nr:DUF3592 domain-containing protein [Desulfatibacillum aliphaticivorans]ACL04781.1 hypothetical protein Dalk_3091 [Desulfatibacillum aliphaticivorans]